MLIKKFEVGTSQHIIFQTKTERQKNNKGKYDLLDLEIITECVCKFPCYKKQRTFDWRKFLFRHSYKTIWMSASTDIANSQIMAPFLVWEGRSCKPGRSWSFSAVKRDAHSKGAFIYAVALFQIITVNKSKKCSVLHLF